MQALPPLEEKEEPNAAADSSNVAADNVDPSGSGQPLGSCVPEYGGSNGQLGRCVLRDQQAVTKNIRDGCVRLYPISRLPNGAPKRPLHSRQLVAAVELDEVHIGGVGSGHLKPVLVIDTAPRAGDARILAGASKCD